MYDVRIIDYCMYVLETNRTNHSYTLSLSSQRYIRKPYIFSICLQVCLFTKRPCPTIVLKAQVASTAVEKYNYLSLIHVMKL